ncbi:penicillin binding protein transpeptidase domain-containing protein [Leptospira perolatii]|uniref:Penicillin binding protein transpeptidase domain-containing protein n=1 Tax=Leptospira perolatii TaxID=2023191 RepID=A0A2M9ZQI9_9LEPT|nr:penicillin-binding transpeptidase domain-containing protein [Leptospira perolatii]PJZ68302.1 penicillin binding protein transpeptidase domain-containing protein [Leptospira perolatii]PJZ74231.1 penicillin binding protein transpeptidase domain-containing protein [Leptospira perolatii]
MKARYLSFVLALSFASCSHFRTLPPFVDSPNLEVVQLETPGRNTCLLLAEMEKGFLVRMNQEVCLTKTSPTYLFQSILALSALEIGSLKDPYFALRWDRTQYPYIRWQKDQNLRSALETSAVWYFQKVWSDAGPTKVKAWLANTGLPSELPKDSTRLFWVDGGYSVSAEDFFKFLAKAFREELGVRRKNLDFVLDGLERNPGEVRLPSGIHRVEGNWGNPTKYFSDSGTAFAGGKSISWFWFFGQYKDRSILFLTRTDSETETLSPLDSAKFGADYLLRSSLWSKLIKQ